MQAQMQIQDQPAVVDFDINLTRSLVPLKDMSEAHLLALLDDVVPEVACAGQTLFSEGSYDDQHVYLLHGNVSLVAPDGQRQAIKGRESLFPIAHHQPRRVTAIADSDCSLLRINSERLDKMLAWSQVADYLQLLISRQRDLDEDVDWMMTVLKSNLFFKVPPLNVEEIFSCLTPQVVYAGDVVIRQGELGEQCYFIKEGEADVTRHVDGNREHLATISVGRCFGEDALVNETVRNATVMMRTDGVLMRLEKQDFYKLLKEPQVATLALAELEAALATHVCVDVRSEEEYTQAHLPRAVNVPLNILAIKSRLLSKTQPTIFYCDTGRRSRAAAHLLSQQGYKAWALADCADLLEQSKYASYWLDSNNYLLRDGVAVPSD
ncbi:cyclic nucleotide-binding domain-containing protein [Cellvibrio japonicus]|uniref:cyclic nucleotide-binding domain-containing protein n=1 Tax=Cellvibrio japonicus TaxID=155077 RepID=UPI0002E3CED9|nr:cyclic nucleotide-binding domain-containing protein [Cellvibrio japonicus]QEI12628.1 cyclic nucleotide-binding domain-containing protein [Cellvibrio japonicus]QEI16202.1 cyclic nucleotide-binding domain-containing protein [Cellvibrio japonicus]QEI19780.1 cyclic nucleotide-binding domain-containing protein [Cellvibrio japonicus]